GEASTLSEVRATARPKNGACHLCRADARRSARHGARDQARSRDSRRERPLSMSAADPAIAAPLAGIRVLDLTRLLPGPVCTLYLADFGADVIKIEDTGAGDYSRRIGARRTEVSAFYRLINRNKRSLAVDLKNPRGRDAFLALA